MLEYLHIRNLALIEDMELDFHSGMNVLTGETGAGKSFIIKALNFVLGDKLDISLVRPNAAKAEVQALFRMDSLSEIASEDNVDEEIILRRELIAETGRSRFFLNGNLTSQETVRQMRSNLILHASQHGQQKLLQPAFQSKLIDQFLEESSLLEQKDVLLSSLKEISLKKRNISKRIGELQEKREFLESQQEIITKVAPESGEEEKLELIRSEFRSIERIQSLYDKALATLRGEQSLYDVLGTFERLIASISAIDNSFADDLDDLRELTQLIQEIEKKLRNKPTIQNSEGYEIENLERRLFELAQLKRKLKRTLPQILNLQAEITENLSFLDNAELDLKQLDREERVFVEKLQALLEELNSARRRAANLFCTALENELRGLGFSEQLKVLPNISQKEIWESIPDLPPTLEDIITLLFAPNPGQPPQPLDRIASGGELSRFLLAITSLQAQSEPALLIFDEVDAGIGGLTLNKVAERLAYLAESRQMLLITHWANLAERGQKHFYVEKLVKENQTYTTCKSLSHSEIKQELLRMTGQE